MLAIAYAVAILIGWLLVDRVLPRCGDGLARRVLVAGLAIPVGLGITSCTHFLWLVWFGVAPPVCFGLECLLLLAIGGAWMRRQNSLATLPAERAPRGLVVAFAVVCLFAVVGFVFATLRHPAGYDDSLAIWNLRAKFLYAYGPNWPQLFTDHKERGILFADQAGYPLLVPCAVARLWAWQGGLSPWAPAIIAFSFCVAAVLVPLGIVGLLRGRTQGLLAGLAVASTAYLVTLGAAQYADLPLACYLAAGCALFAVHYQERGRSYGVLALAGLCAGLAAWTKNEGSLLVTAVLAAHLLIALARREAARYGRQLLALLMGLTPALSVLIYFKMRLAVAVELLAAQSTDALVERLADLSRYGHIAVSFAGAYWHVGRAVGVLLPLYVLLLGLRPGWRREPGVWFCTIVVSVMLSGYSGIYLITPHDFAWHVSRSVDRLVLHLWPTVVIALFMLAATPEASGRTHDR